MKIIKKVLSTSFLIIGIPILVAGITELLKPESDEKNTKGAIGAIAFFSFPPLALGSGLAWNLRQQHKASLRKLARQQEQTFLQLLQKHKNITVTQFAIEAQVSIEEAKIYLDRKAVQLDANFEAAEEGGILYKFPK